jgi:outer membrane protein OmpA-like peptidoglycan-associated protein
MNGRTVILIVVVFVGGLLLNGCATEPQHLTMQQPNGERQAMTVPESTWTGAASGEQTHSVASLVVDTNNNTQQRFDRMAGDIDKIHARGDENLKMNRETLAKLEDISVKQGSGQVTLFFKTGSARLDQAQVWRLVGFCDYVARESRGRTVTLVSIGQASTTGSAEYNKKLSEQRSEAPLPVVDKYLVDVPHNFHRVTGVGEAHAPEMASSEINSRYQSVRIIAVYDASSLPNTPAR